METNDEMPTIFDEKQSLQVIREMIQVSQKKLKNDGILFILWGWMMFFSYLTSYLTQIMIITYRIEQIIKYFNYFLSAGVIMYTIYYIIVHQRKVQTYIGISLRYVWISLFLCLVLTNLIEFNVLHSINFELQHPIFMVFIAFATVISGGILRYRLLIAGGIVFALLAYTCSYFDLTEQLLIEAIGWLISFIIPGYVMYSKRNT